MKKTILISILTILGFCGASFAQENYQGQLSDKKLQSMGTLSSGSTSKGYLETSKQDSLYDYDEEYENLLKSIHVSNKGSYELDSSMLDADLTHYEDDYDDMLDKASKVLGKEKVDALTMQTNDTFFNKESRKTVVEISGNITYIFDDGNTNKQQIIYIKNTDEIIREHFSVKNNMEDGIVDSDVASNNAKSYAANDDTDNLYQNLLAELSDGSGDEVDQLFNFASEEELEGEEYKYKLDDGYSLEEITTVGLFKGQKKRFKKCLIMKVYGGGTWRTYCQPIAKPTQCTDQEWRDLSTMPIMFC